MVSFPAGASLTALFQVGCSSHLLPPGHVTDGPADSSIAAVGDWDDTAAAAEVGLGRAECVMVGAGRPDEETSITYTFKHISGRTGQLTFARPQAPAGVAPGEWGGDVTIRCGMSPLRDPELERRILLYVSQRLRELYGVEYAPIPD